MKIEPVSFLAVGVIGAFLAAMYFIPMDPPKKRAAESEAKRGTICMNCVGPHLNLSTGKVGIISVGPGIQF